MNNIKSQIEKLEELINNSDTILLLQPEKPDTDSLASALAFEQLLEGLGKQVEMYCQDDVPPYLRHLPGWDRVAHDFPNRFDFTILVDTGGPQMLSRTLDKHSKALSSKPFVIVDHHGTRSPMPFPTIDIIDPAMASTGELIVIICRQLDWKINAETANLIVPSILADTRGLTVPTTTADTVQTVADMVRLGADLYALNQLHLASGAIEPDILQYKGKLLTRIEYFNNGTIAVVIVPPDELRTYAERHDPSDLVIYDMQRAKGVLIAAVLRNYDSELHGRKIKISMRANLSIAAPAAEHFGGGGHPQAAGCTVLDRPAEAVKTELVDVLTKLINEHEAI